MVRVLYINEQEKMYAHVWTNLEKSLKQYFSHSFFLFFITVQDAAQGKITTMRREP